MPGGRPSIYTEELAKEICKHIAGGGNLAALCRRDDMPDRTTVYDWIYNKPEFSHMYARAREIRADGFQEELLEIARGEPDTHRAKLIIDTQKWIMSKMLPKNYGDKVTQQIETKDTEINFNVRVHDKCSGVGEGSDSGSEE